MMMIAQADQSRINQGDRGTPGPTLQIQSKDLNARRVQQMRDREGLGPDPTIPGILRDAAAEIAACRPNNGRAQMPNPHHEFDHALYRLLRRQILLGGYTESEVCAWYDENEK